jgi:hypothetical protein
MEAVSSYEMCTSIYQIPWCHIQGESNLYNYLGGVNSDITNLDRYLSQVIESNFFRVYKYLPVTTASNPRIE